MTSKEYADGLRAIADWYEQHPEVAPPRWPEVQDSSCADDKETAVRIAEALKPCIKAYDSSLFKLERLFGPVKLRFLFWRSAVCERRVVGTKEVPEITTPAYIQEITEWDCHPLLEEGSGA